MAGTRPLPPFHGPMLELRLRLLGGPFLQGLGRLPFLQRQAHGRNGSPPGRPCLPPRARPPVGPLRSQAPAAVSPQPALDRVAVISTDTFAVRVLETDGAPRRILRRSVVLEAVTEQHVEAFLQSILGLISPEGSEPAPEEVANVRQMWEESPRASTLPILRSVHLDSEGNIWVEPYVHTGAAPERFQVFAADGEWPGEVALPQGQHRGFVPRRAPSFQIGSDFVLGVWADEMDVQYHRLYGLEKEWEWRGVEVAGGGPHETGPPCV